MFCKNCGNQIPDEAKFCKHCGGSLQGVSAPSVNTCSACGAQNTEGAQFCRACGKQMGGSAPVQPSAPMGQPVPPKKKNTGLIVGIIAAAVILLVAVALGVVYAFGFLDGEKEESGKKPLPTASPQITVAPTATPSVDVAKNIDAYLAGKGQSYNVSVAVYDNTTKKMYCSSTSELSYPAWGFYLPIYLAADDAGVDAITQEGVMSSDIGVCNQAGNAVITAFGGPHGVTQYLARNYNASVTSYGRRFADVNSTGENYTNAKEAAQFLAVLNGRGECTKLSYNPSSFGITAPYGTGFYCQVGSENKAKLNNLNLFAVVKGQKSDYCIAVLSQNGAGKQVMNELLQLIHNDMERA
ncbi:MAG: zinc-ribbon domain-containing protein [Clostridia bacterium]|nr:zinc-ribbon domain-containing protein [Clostridia bacterium]